MKNIKHSINIPTFSKKVTITTRGIVCSFFHITVLHILTPSVNQEKQRPGKRTPTLTHSPFAWICERYLKDLRTPSEILGMP